MNYRKESGSREIQALSPGLLTMIVKIRLKHVRKCRSVTCVSPPIYCPK